MSRIGAEIERLVRTHGRRLLDREADLAVLLQVSLTELLPAEPVMTSPAAVPVCRSLAHSFLTAAAALQAPDVGVATLRQAGADLQRAGFPESGYQSVGHALLRSLREANPSGWSGVISSAWVEYYFWAREHWLYGATAARQYDESLPGIQKAAPTARDVADDAPAAEDAADLDEGDGDDDDDGGLSYGQLMVGMTRPVRLTRDPHGDPLHR